LSRAEVSADDGPDFIDDLVIDTLLQTEGHGHFEHEASLEKGSTASLGGGLGRYASARSLNDGSFQ
jgi:hypothetical protein